MLTGSSYSGSLRMSGVTMAILSEPLRQAFYLAEYDFWVSEPSETAVKTLFALSRNQCYMAACERELTKPEWKRVAGEIAHIKGEHPGSPRYDEAQDDKERQGFDNLILLCPTCHKIIDWLEPDAYPPDVLYEIKQRHIEHAPYEEWCSDYEAASFARSAIEYWLEQSRPRTGLSILSARYGADETWADVTTLLNGRVVDDALTVIATNDSLGGDPVVNVVKTLVVRFEQDGVVNSISVQEGDTLTIPKR